MVTQYVLWLDQLEAKNDFEFLRSSTPHMLEVRQRLRNVALTKAPVLIIGEVGTGKGLAARFIHAHSHRAATPLIRFNCAGTPRQEVTRAIFGERYSRDDKPGHRKDSLPGAAGKSSLLLEIIKRIGCKTTECKDGLEALHAFSSSPEKFHLIISDYMMPFLNGIQLAEKIRKIDKHVPIIICMGDSSDLVKSYLTDNTVNEILPKPTTIAGLKSCICNFI